MRALKSAFLVAGASSCSAQAPAAAAALRASPTDKPPFVGLRKQALPALGRGWPCSPELKGWFLGGGQMAVYIFPEGLLPFFADSLKSSYLDGTGERGGGAGVPTRNAWAPFQTGLEGAAGGT